MRTKLALIAAVAAAVAAGPGLAHHSFAMFDMQKEVLLEGTVKEFQWTNPHSWIQVMVKDPATGKEVEWSLEGGSPNALARRGWKRSSIKPGDRISATIHPLKDGQPGGAFSKIVVNGQTIGG